MAVNELRFKVVLLGDPDVGKTSILLKYTNNEFSETTPTQPVSEKLKKMRVNGREMALEIWDTAGQERYRSLETHYYRDADAALIVYSVTDEESFSSVCDYWLKESLRYLPDETTIPIQLIGNKCDLLSDNSSTNPDSTTIPFDTVREYSEAYDVLPPIECSAKTGYNIDKVFGSVASDLYRRHVKQAPHSRASVHKLSDSDNKMSFSCCGSNTAT